MSALLGAPPPPLAGAAPRRVARPAAAAAGLVVFWYGMTGLLLALERSGATRLLALGLAVLAAAAGVLCTRAARRRDGAGAGAAAVVGGALLWTCVSAAFYGGWVVGPAPSPAPPGLDAAPSAPSVARALDALAATAYSSALAAGLLLVAAWAARAPRTHGHTDEHAAARRVAAARLAPATFATLWAAHELAKLNVFVGVASPGAAYLPAYLAHLRPFFGPARNSPLLACSVVGLGAAAALVAWRARHFVGDPARRTGLALLAGVVALAAFEHAMLGVRTPPDWWDAFVTWREAPARAARPPAAARAAASGPHARSEPPSARFPLYTRTPQTHVSSSVATVGDFRAATYRVYRSARYPSRAALRVVTGP